MRAFLSFVAALVTVLSALPAQAQLNCWGWERNLPQCQGVQSAVPRPPMNIERPRPAAMPAQRYELPEHLRKKEFDNLQIGNLRTGDIFIDRARTYLYLITGPTSAIRYGIGVGREGFGEKTVGEYYIKSKQKNPWWYPPKEMQLRDPNAARYPRGMPPGPHNPLGEVKAELYDAKEQHGRKAGSDSLFRIHGTNAPESIGTAKSSGCFRMLNEDAKDLYERVVAGGPGTGTRVFVQ